MSPAARTPALVLLVLAFVAGDVRGQALASPRLTPWTVGPTVSWSGKLPAPLLNDPCGSLGTYGIGVASDWRPFGSQRWIGVQSDALLVVPVSERCATAPLPPEGERTFIEPDVEAPFLAVSGRAVVEVPFEPGGLRVHGGGGLLLDGLRPAVSRGIGWFMRQGRFTGSLVLDWWTIWPGGHVVRAEWGGGAVRRERTDPYDEAVSMRFFLVSIGWDVGTPFAMEPS